MSNNQYHYSASGTIIKQDMIESFNTNKIRQDIREIHKDLYKLSEDEHKYELHDFILDKPNVYENRLLFEESLIPLNNDMYYLKHYKHHHNNIEKLHAPYEYILLEKKYDNMITDHNYEHFKAVPQQQQPLLQHITDLKKHLKKAQDTDKQNNSSNNTEKIQKLNKEITEYTKISNEIKQLTPPTLGQYISILQKKIIKNDDDQKKLNYAINLQNTLIAARSLNRKK